MTAELGPTGKDAAPPPLPPDAGALGLNPMEAVDAVQTPSNSNTQGPTFENFPWTFNESLFLQLISEDFHEGKRETVSTEELEGASIDILKKIFIRWSCNARLLFRSVRATAVQAIVTMHPSSGRPQVRSLTPAESDALVSGTQEAVGALRGECASLVRKVLMCVCAR